MAEVRVSSADDAENSPPSFQVKPSASMEFTQSNQRKNSTEHAQRKDSDPKTTDSELKPGDNNVQVPYR